MVYSVAISKEVDIFLKKVQRIIKQNWNVESEKMDIVDLFLLGNSITYSTGEVIEFENVVYLLDVFDKQDKRKIKKNKENGC